MTRRTISAAALGAGLILGLARVGAAQAVPQGELRELAHELSEQVHRLGEEMREDYDQVPQARQLIEEAREVEQAVREFGESVVGRANPFQLRQTYSGIDVSWHHLRGQLARLAGTSRGVDKSAERVEEIDRRIHQALGMNEMPPGFYGGAAQAPNRVDNVRRLAHALVSRAQQLAAMIPTEMGNDPNAEALAQVANDLAAAADRFHDSLNAGQEVDDLRAAYGPVEALINRLNRPLAAGAPPRVQQVWNGTVFANNHLRQALGLAAPAAAPPGGLEAPPIGQEFAQGIGARAFAPLADRLVAQVDAFVQGFAPLANAGPENEAIMADAERLRADAIRFRQAIDRAPDAGQLAFEYRDIDATWQRLWRRIERAARGANGPNVQRAREIGPTCARLHQMLGMPGYSPD